jgi:serine/threonine-protein kinase
MVEDRASAVPNVLVAGKYRLSRLLGRGGMGSVWEGVHATLGTRVAVKFIETDYAGNEEARQRFENEARAAARLRSKHVVKVYDHGLLDDGRPYIVMEYLDGEPLDRRLDRVRRLLPAETARIMAQVGRALTNAHGQGIVHRDLKPENIFLVWDEEDQSDVAKVVDFGIAKFTDNAAGLSSATRTGSLLGTPFYMSPEQARGLRTVDYRSDLWSLGVITYRCLVGTLPFDGEALGDLLVKICTAPLPVPSAYAPDVPQGFDAWFAKALAREPADRFGSAAELAETLALVCGITALVVAPRDRLESSGMPMVVGQTGVPTPPQAQAQTAASFTQTPTPLAGTGKASRRTLALVVLGMLTVTAGAIALAVKLLGAATGTAAADPTASATAPVLAAEPPPPATTALPASDPTPPTASAGEAEPLAPAGSASAEPAAERRPPASTPKKAPEATKATPAKVEAKPRPKRQDNVDLGY